MHKHEAANGKPIQNYALKIIRAGRGIEGEEWKKNSRKKRKAIEVPEEVEVPINKTRRADGDDDFFQSDTDSDTEGDGKGGKSGYNDASDSDNEPSETDEV